MNSLTRRTWLGAAAGLGLAGCVGPLAPSPDPTGGGPASSTASSPTPAPSPVLRFATASDGHLGQTGTPSKRYLGEMVAAVNDVDATTPIEVLILNGDLADSGRSNLEAVRDGLAELRPPYLAIPGNHDRVSNQVWKQVWGTPPNLVRRYGERSVVLANTSNRAGDFRCASVDWLSEALAAEAGQRDVFVFMHITPKSWTKYGLDCPEVRQLLAETPNVRAVFNGHDHDQAGIKVDAGLPYVFDSHYGGDWGTTQRAFRLVEVEEASLTTWLVTTAGKALKPETIAW